MQGRSAVPCCFAPEGLTNRQFSHDLDVNRKSEKKDVYTDARREGASVRCCFELFVRKSRTDTMDKWDDAKLQEVVLSKSACDLVSRSDRRR